MFLTIVGNTFKVYRNSKVEQYKKLRTNNEVVELLENVFDIHVPETYHNFLYENE